MFAAEIDNSLRNISTVSGRYVLRGEARRPGVNILACRLRTISPFGFIATAPAVGEIGDIVSASFAPFGMLNGRISRHVGDGFAVELEGADAQQDALAGRIETFRHRVWNGMADRRAAKRFMPAEPRSVLIRESWAAVPCLVVDYSAAGAAISADVRPVVGEPVLVGQMSAKVVRLFDVGFAVRFDALEPGDEIERLLEAPPQWRGALAVIPPMRIDTSEPGDPQSDGYGYD
jgi:hypothetical protein